VSKVYVLTEGEYSDYHIVGVYSTKEDAEAAKRWILGVKNVSSYFASGVVVEEYELDPHADAIRQGLTAYRVRMAWNGDTEAVYRADDDAYGRTICMGGGINALAQGVSGVVFARDEQHAVKIVNEKRAQMIAQGIGPPNRDNAVLVGAGMGLGRRE